MSAPNTPPHSVEPPTQVQTKTELNQTTPPDLNHSHQHQHNTPTPQQQQQQQQHQQHQQQQQQALTAAELTNVRQLQHPGLHDMNPGLHLGPGQLPSHHSFNHPFSINNLMSESKLDMKMYETMQNYGAYGQMSPLTMPKESSPPMQANDGNYYKYVPHSTASL